MRVVQVREFGPPGVLVPADVEEHSPGPGQLVILVHAAGVNLIDTMQRSGRVRPPDSSRRTCHKVGGTVSAVGEGVDAGLVGQSVVSSTGGTGGYAERALVGVEEVNVVPDRLDLRRAVAVRAAGRTALALMAHAKVAPGERVLVEATAGSGVDVAFESLGGAVGRQAFGLLARCRGRLVVFGFSGGTPNDVTAGELFGTGLTVTSFGGPQFGDPAWVRAKVAEALDLTAAGTLVPTIGQTYPLDDAADARANLEARTAIGKTLLLP